MYRIAMALVLGITSLLIAYGQFRALPGLLSPGSTRLDD
jgi:hypothetical protein